jgi:polyhydroxyalkanoate synthase subunit PhaC
VVSTSGHIQALVNPPSPETRASYRVIDDPADKPESWVANADVKRGSWWPDYRDWLTKRAGGLKPSPKTLGSRKHRATAKAPGSYVHAR